MLIHVIYSRCYPLYPYHKLRCYRFPFSQATMWLYIIEGIILSQEEETLQIIVKKLLFNYKILEDIYLRYPSFSAVSVAAKLLLPDWQENTIFVSLLGLTLPYNCLNSSGDLLRASPTWLTFKTNYN